jgi:hypothetical protein
MFNDVFSSEIQISYIDAINCSLNPNFPAANAGHMYSISVGGKIGGASGDIVVANEMIICKINGSLAGTKAAVGANWIVPTNIVTGTTLNLDFGTV